MDLADVGNDQTAVTFEQLRPFLMRPDLRLLPGVRFLAAALVCFVSHKPKALGDLLEQTVIQQRSLADPKHLRSHK